MNAPWALSIDVEEYFQVANLRAVFPEQGWDGLASRLDHGMDALLAALERHGARATFFFLGWVAERRPMSCAAVTLPAMRSPATVGRMLSCGTSASRGWSASSSAPNRR